MWQPGFVKVQRSDLAIEQLLQRFHVVDDAVISALSDRQNARLATGMLGLSGLGKRICFDLSLDVFRSEFIQRDRADDPEMIASRSQEHRNGPGHDDGVQNRLVTVPVDDNDVARCDCRMPHHLV